MALTTAHSKYDWPTRRGTRTTRAGRGLRGIGERAAALGGTTTASADGGRWTLSVALPAGTLQR